jgi:hypothetical protein
VAGLHVVQSLQRQYDHLLRLSSIGRVARPGAGEGVRHQLRRGCGLDCYVSPARRLRRRKAGLSGQVLTVLMSGDDASQRCPGFQAGDHDQDLRTALAHHESRSPSGA